MNRITAWTVSGLCLSFAACGGSDEPREAPDMELSELSEATPIVESGCLTASGDRFVLTALETGGNRATELYQLIGDSAELREHVGDFVGFDSVMESGDLEVEFPGEVEHLRLFAEDSRLAREVVLAFDADASGQ